jgi:Terpene cyclase DEP1
MKLKTVYLLLCVVGLVLPYTQFVPWVAENGLHLRLFFQQLFANRVGGFFVMDVLVSAVALMVFARAEGRRLKVGARALWLTLLAVLTVGVSLGLPLFLYLRERRLEQERALTGTATA